jgi:glycyl-tRNA synthetase beta chain
MPRLLFEIGTEELPAPYVRTGGPALAALVTALLEEVKLPFGDVRSFATPRRLAVLVEDVADVTDVHVERRRGPAVSAAFDAEGRPTRAAVGFAAGAGVRVEDLVEEETEKGRYVVARREVGGEDGRAVLTERLGALVDALPAPRKMRWADVETAFVRPVAWLVAMWGESTLDVRAAGLRAGAATRGHRFAHPAPIELADPSGYENGLRDAGVIADRGARAATVADAIAATSAAEGLTAAAPPALLEEIVDLVEWPVPVLGAFDDAYLALPDEVLTTVMIHHQRFVPLRTSDGRLAPRFVAISNHQARDMGVVRGGYERVLAGRLYDAGFFWEADRRKSLSQHAWALSGIAFQKDLGTMADKVARTAVAAIAIAEVLGVREDERATLDRALPIFRADLATEMVAELPELEGTMARAYAQAEGAPAAVAQALEDGVLPRGPSDALPATRMGAVLAVADRLDKLLGFFALGKRPSGSADPFALRRDAVAIARIVAAHGWRLPLGRSVQAAAEAYADGPVAVDADTIAAVEAFLWDRVAGLLHEEGLGTNVVRAATGGSRSVIAAARRAHLLRALATAETPAEREAFADLLALYKRAANLAEKAEPGVLPKTEAFVEPAEEALGAALPAAQRAVEGLLAAVRERLEPWDLGRGPARTLTGVADQAAGVLRLKAPLDAFLDDVLVMVDDAALRRNRLALLAQVTFILRELGSLEHLGA